MRFPALFIAFLLSLVVIAPPLFAEENPNALAGLHIDGIAYDNKHPEESIAVINAIEFRPGDEYRGYKIAEIAQDHIMMVSAESGTAYELSPGDGKSNVQKREGWNPLKDLKMPELPDMKKPNTARAKAPAVSRAEKDEKAEAAADALKKLNPFNTLYESKARMEKQIDEIKAEQNKRIDLLNNIMDGMEQKPQAQEQK